MRGRHRGRERDPYAWLETYGARLAAVQLQQSDAAADHHWPFTDAHNEEGRIDADRVLAALEASGAKEVPLLFEVIPSFEQDDDSVVADLVASVRYWQDALDRHASQTAANLRPD